MQVVVIGRERLPLRAWRGEGRSKLRGVWFYLCARVVQCSSGPDGESRITLAYKRVSSLSPSPSAFLALSAGNNNATQLIVPWVSWASRETFSPSLPLLVTSYHIPQARLHSQTHSGDFLPVPHITVQARAPRAAVDPLSSRTAYQITSAGTHHVRDSIRNPVRMTAIRADHRSFLNMNLFPYDLRWPPTRP